LVICLIPSKEDFAGVEFSWLLGQWVQSTHNLCAHLHDTLMTWNWVVGMEISDDFFSAFESLSVSLLLFKQLVFISSFLFFDEVESFLDHIIKILRFFIYSPSVFYLLWFKLEHVIFHNYVDFSVSINFCFHLLDLQHNWSLEIVL
jgi:hypothetical protein